MASRILSFKLFTGQVKRIKRDGDNFMRENWGHPLLIQLSYAPHIILNSHAQS